MGASDTAIDLLAIGELLVDLISTEPTDSLATAARFERYQGGSPANIAVNVARLGGRAAVMARVGDDALGVFLRQELADAGVQVADVQTDGDAHTSVVLVARTATTPDFLPMRDADFRLDPADLEASVARARAVHTSTWPLSREPARQCAVRALHIAHARGKVTSLDPNYTPRIWPDRDEALEMLGEVLPYVTVTKPSADDAARLFGETLASHEVIRRFHAMGPPLVLFTMGAEGMIVSVDGDQTHVPARQLEVVDATGAGDAFWSGFLMAHLDGLPPAHCAYVARELAERKLKTIGPMPEMQDRTQVYAKAREAMRTA
jgi:fructokinase